jgi:hypothetical protein
MSGRPDPTNSVIEKLLKPLHAFCISMIKGKAVVLNIAESKDSSLLHKIVRGKIHGICEIALYGQTGSTISEKTKTCALVKLDSPISINGQTHDCFIVIPRHSGHGFYRLLLSWIAVYVIPANFPPDPAEVFWDNIIGIWTLKLGR